MFQFSHDRPCLEGVFLGASRVTVKGKETTQYMLQDSEGNRFSFLATYDLLRKIQPAHAGRWMQVAFEGEDADVKTQGSPIRKFRVAVSREKEPEFVNAHGIPISDEDIPF
ncbi:MAG: hypothetical protein H0X25_11130 [Acidobacteriales bacterium]|nr:hypothetical protein [Terriglobales bacterium]